MALKKYEILENCLEKWQLGAKVSEHPVIGTLLLKLLQPLAFRQETSLNHKMRYGYVAMGGGFIPVEELKISKHGFYTMIEALENIFKAEREGIPIVFNDYPVPIEIIQAFGVPTLCPIHFLRYSHYGGMNAATELLEAAEEHGMDNDICSVNKLAIGSILLDQVPKPELYITSSLLCDSSRGGNQLIDYLLDVPSFSYDGTYDKTLDDMKWLSKNAFKMISFLEKHLKRKIDWDKLKTNLLNLNDFNHYFYEVTEMHRSVPSPDLVGALRTGFSLKGLNTSSEHNVTFAKELYELAKKRIEKDSEKNRKKEKIRMLLWEPPLIFADINVWLKQEFGAVQVVDFVARTGGWQIDTSTEESMLEGLAREKLNLTMLREHHGNIELNIMELERALEEFSVDCVIYTGNDSCKHNKASSKIVMDLLKKYELPILNMEIDSFDKRRQSEEEVKRRIEEFFVSNGLA